MDRGCTYGHRRSCSFAAEGLDRTFLVLNGDSIPTASMAALLNVPGTVWVGLCLAEGRFGLWFGSN